MRWNEVVFDFILVFLFVRVYLNQTDILMDS